MREYTGGYARTTVQQNLVLRWVRDEALYDVWQRLKALELAEPGAHEITDVVSCPGTDSCKLGITSSMGLNRAVQQRLEQMEIDDELTRKIHVKMSGCPNGCSQHHIANIGFYGASLKVGGRQMPAYIPHLGGNYEGGEVIFGNRLKSRLPAKRVPEAVSAGSRSTRPSATRARSSTPSSSGSAPSTSKRRQGPDDAGRVQPRDDAAVHRLEPLQPYKVERGEGECAI